MVVDVLGASVVVDGRSNAPPMPALRRATLRADHWSAPDAGRRSSRSGRVRAGGRRGHVLVPVLATRPSAWPRCCDVLADGEGLEADASVESGRRGLATALERRERPGVGVAPWKRRELLRIAARDLTGIADLAGRRPRAGRARRGRASAPRSRSSRPTIPLAVIGMGKLGGAELNYASDVDVLFVDDGDRGTSRPARAAVPAR